MLTSLVVTLASAGIAYSQTSKDPHYTRTQIRHMTVDAHTVQDYKTLEAYFYFRRQVFSSKAREAKAEWVRRSRILPISTPWLKYPSPVDAARNLYEYYALKVSDMTKNAEHYEMLAAAASPTSKGTLLAPGS